MKRSTASILAVAAAALVILAVVSGTGFYVVPRYELATSCDTCGGGRVIEKAETIWFFRPGTNAPFIASDGGLLMRYKKAGYGLFDRIRLTADSRGKIKEQTILHLPYIRFLYRLSAGGRLPVKYDEAF